MISSDQLAKLEERLDKLEEFKDTVIGRGIFQSEIANTDRIQILSNKALKTPVIDDFTNATHAHSGTSAGGAIAPAIEPWVDVRAYSTLALANTAAYDNGKTLLITKECILPANTTLTAAVKVIKGGSFTKASTYTLTINGSFEPGLYQVFSGFSAGDVTFGNGAIKEARPEWWLTNTTPGTTDMITAIQSAVDSFKLTKLGQTEYGISSAISLGWNKKLIGEGRFVSILKALTNSQTMIELVSGTGGASYPGTNVEISNLGLKGNSKTAITAITGINACEVYFHNLYFEDVTYTFDLDRGWAITIRDVLNAQLDGGLATGKARFYDSTGSAYLQHLLIDGYIVQTRGSALGPVLLLRRVAPASIKNFNSNGLGVIGIQIDDDSQGIRVSNSMILAPTKGIYVDANGGNSPVFLTFIGVDIDQPSDNAYQFSSGNNHHVIGGSITNGGGNAITIGTPYVSIDGLEIDTFAGNGIVAAAGIGNFSIKNNRIYHITSTAIVVSVGASNYYSISNNDVSHGNGGTIVDGGTGSNKNIKNNLGYNPVGNVAPALPASTVAYTNAYGQDCQVTIYGGTVTAIGVNGTITGLTNGTFLVPAGETISITYSSAPAWTWTRN